MLKQRCGTAQIETAAGGHGAGDFLDQSTGFGGLPLTPEEQKAGTETAAQTPRNPHDLSRR